MLNTHFANLIKSYIPTIEQLTHCYAFAIPVENSRGDFGVDIELTDGGGIHELYSFYMSDGKTHVSLADDAGHRANVMLDICESLNSKVCGRENHTFNREDYFERNGLPRKTDADQWDQVEGLRFTKEDSEPVKVYFDMDGTLAVFNKNATMEEVFSPGYFRNLAPIPEMIDLASELCERGYDVNILSGACHSALQEKIEWLQEHMPFITPDHYTFVPVDADKSQFIPDPRHSILIDDYNKNLDAWKGLALKCKTDINSHNPKYTSLEVGTDMLITFLEAVNQKMSKDHISLGDYLSLSHTKENIKRPMVVCNDGFTMYVSADDNSYCFPKFNLENGNEYREVEISYPSMNDEALCAFASEYLYIGNDITENTLPHVPVEIVEQVLENHGGINAHRTFTDLDQIHFDLDNRWLTGELDDVLSPDGIEYIEKAETADSSTLCIGNSIAPLIDLLIEECELPDELQNGYITNDYIDFEKIEKLNEYVNSHTESTRVRRIVENIDYRIKESHIIFDYEPEKGEHYEL